MKILDLARPKEEFQNDISWMHLVTSLASWHGSLIFSLLKWCLLTNQNVILGLVLQTMPQRIYNSHYSNGPPAMFTS